ncbi:MAG: hypothetical protein NDI82_07215 [Anaeromyxobacteraceae bacterium]|nr:hypothetical protein [Anaeromyxobacteraceae bacterium]
MDRPAARLLALPLLLALAAPAPAALPEAVETDDEALQAIRQAVQARDAHALIGRVGGAGVEDGEKLVSPGWVKKYLVKPESPLATWVFGPVAPAAGKPAPWSMAACLSGEVTLRRAGADRAEVRCRKGAREATFGLTRHQGRWAITQDFFWPNDGVR